jgi:hypothetical protein
MKNMLKNLALIALVAAIGFSMAACNNNDPEDEGPALGSKDNPILLEEGVWTYGELTAEVRELYYYFPCEENDSFTIWWTNYVTFDQKLGVRGFYDDNTSIAISNSTTETWLIGKDNGTTGQRVYVKKPSEKVILRVLPWDAGNKGPFCLVYSSSTTKPTGGTVASLAD